MANSKVQIGATVISGKYGKGIITEIITKSTGYVAVDFSGNVRKEMAFNLTDENGDLLKSKPGKPQERILSAEEKVKHQIAIAKKMFLSVNDQFNNNSTWKTSCWILNKVDAKGNDFIESLLDSFFRKEYLSDVQAYYLAKFVVETGQF